MTLQRRPLWATADFPRSVVLLTSATKDGGSKATVKIPVSCFSPNLDFENVNTPFLVYTEAAFSVSFANVRWVPGAGKDPDARKCSDLT
ncbi:putative glycoside hydrolase [Sphaerisporangium sp. NPDC004334]